MKVYIATKLENYRKHNEVRDALAGEGIEITYDWSIHGPVWESGVQRIREVSLLEFGGVRDADIVVVILHGGRGTHVELGMAIALKKPILLLAETDEIRRMKDAVAETCAFYHHPLCTWTYGIEHLLNYARWYRDRGSTPASGAGNGSVDEANKKCKELEIA